MVLGPGDGAGGGEGGGVVSRLKYERQDEVVIFA